METNIEIIRKACIAANPSILDLTFGCEVIPKQGELSGIVIKVFENNTVDVICRKEIEEQKAVITLEGCPVERLEILGRPITLPDVLLAMNKIDAYGVGSDGRFILGTEWVKEKNGLFAMTWNLTKSLEDQSPECLSFLAELFTNN